MPRMKREASLGEILEWVYATRNREWDPLTDRGTCLENAVPVAWTSGDHSRLVNKVREELARRREQSQITVPLASDVNVQPNGQMGLFDANLSSCESIGSDQIGCAAQAPARANVLRTDLCDLVATAYGSLMRRLPEDHVVSDPLANAEFVIRCRELGATVPEVILNRTLLNNRKASRHKGVVRECVPRLPPETFEGIGHAVEIGASLVQREWWAVGYAVPSVDDILCNPDLRRALGVYVTALHDNVDPLECHLALLAFRKSGRETAARLTGRDLPERDLLAPYRSLDPESVSEGRGAYRILCQRRPVFVSGSLTLRARIREHIQRGGESLLPASLPFQLDGHLSIEVFNLPDAAPKSELAALTRRLRLCRSEDDVPAPPDLNWREAGSIFSSKDCVIPRIACVG